MILHYWTKSIFENYYAKFEILKRESQFMINIVLELYDEIRLCSF